MKAMVLEKISPIENAPLRLKDVPVPRPATGEALIRVRTCAICRTDLHVIEGELPRGKMPIIPGHQVVGVVESLGDGCTRLSAGQRVGVAWLRHTCGMCPFCSSGRENLCADQRFTGYHADGGYAEYTAAPEEFVYDMPSPLSDVEAAPLLCSGIVGYRALQRARVPAGGTLALYGFGSSAHVIMQIARYRGCRVFVVTRGEPHRDLARRMGAEWVGERAEGLPLKVDSAIVFAPAGELVPAALEKLQKGGTLSLAGIYMTPIPAMDYEKHFFYERDIRSVTANTRQDGREFLAEAAAIPIRPHTATYALADANRALADLKADRIEGTGVLVISLK